ncbi:MAG TPA: SURF1 family cytochrome oxidase biogenesis protein [Caulobacteraceae bacterium]|nr:SURF1 family cytochrome oxidase biogenesis protein [Caulobacteraceae bacterium]
MKGRVRTERAGFPWVLTLATAIVVAICAGLGVWQLQRAQWKRDQLARIAAMRTAPPAPLAPVLARAARGENVDLIRVVAQCLPGPPQRLFRMSVDNGQWIARPLAACAVAAPPYDGIVVDRGLYEPSRGEVSLPTTALPSPGRVVGVLRPPVRGVGGAGLAHPAPWILAVERESPAPPDVTPAPGEAGASDNLQYVGEYAPTWFGLAGVAACVYAAMLWRRYRPRGLDPHR